LGFRTKPSSLLEQRMSTTIHAVRITAIKQAELVSFADDLQPAADEVVGRTIYSLISPGTEIAGAYLGGLKDWVEPGYAAVMRVDAVGDDVTDFSPGDLVYTGGSHRSHQRAEAANVVAVPDGIPMVWAPFARLAGVTMATLNTTTARPPDVVMVTGLGLVGLLGAQMFQSCGYEVVGVDPDETRRAQAKAAGIKRVEAAAPLDDPSMQERVALCLECSGHEQAAIDGAKIVRPQGEVVLVGCPWTKRSDAAAHELLHLVFHRYVVVRSGWEWRLPRHEEKFSPTAYLGPRGHYAAAMKWMIDGRLKIEGLYELVSPIDPQAVYQQIMNIQTTHVAQVYDWAHEVACSPNSVPCVMRVAPASKAKETFHVTIHESQASHAAADHRKAA